MSTELKPLEVRSGQVFVTRFWGGKDGQCLQLTPEFGKIQLTLRDAVLLRDALHDMVLDRWPEDLDDV